jgi:hypothetical protein
MTDPPARHISPQSLDEYISAGVVAALPIAGEPTVQLVVDAANETLRLEISWDGEQPPTISDYVHISTDVRFRQGVNWATLSVHGTRFFPEAYPLLCLVADLVQLESTTFAVAVERGLARYHDLLSASEHMPIREEIGLYGELLALSHVVTTLGPEAALQAWRGGDSSEEHDFGLPGQDVEVKTTTADSRRHWIGSISQLEPTLDRPLWLLSIQVTGAGASDGERLPDLVDRLVDQLPTTFHSLFKTRLAGTSYRPDQPRDTFRLLRLRSAPACYRVDASLPRLTRSLLSASAIQLDRIDEVSYTIRLDGLAPASAWPKPLHGFAEKGSTST